MGRLLLRWTCKIILGIIVLMLSAETSYALGGSVVNKRHRTFDMTLSYNIKIATRGNTRFDLISLLPQSLEGKQKIGEFTYTPEPSSVYLYKGNKYAEWKFKGRAIPKVVEIKCRVELSKFELEKKNTVEMLSKRDKKKYLKREKYLEVGTSGIKNALKEIPSRGSDVERVQAISEYVSKVMDTSQATRKMLGAEKALTVGKGDCTEYADLFVALARQAGLPAKHISGYIVTQSTSIGHSWVEVYTKERGWIRVDPLYLDNTDRDFGDIENKYIEFSDVRNDRELSQGMLYYWSVKNSTGGRVRVKIKVQNKNEYMEGSM